MPTSKDASLGLIDSPAAFRRCLDQAVRAPPALFPPGFAPGYTLPDRRFAAPRGLRRRRVQGPATKPAFSVRPCFGLPYLTGGADDVAGPWFWRGCGVPFGAWARGFGRGPRDWYRRELRRGRNRIVGTSVRRAALPPHLRAAAHHPPRDGVKHYRATTVAAGGCRGAARAPSAGAEDLQAADPVVQQEAPDLRADYQPQTVHTDGGPATQPAGPALFPLVVLLRCFVHGWWNLRSRGKLSAPFAALSEKVWHAYPAPERRSFGQRMRRLGEWAKGQVKAAGVLEPVPKWCGRAREYGEADRHPGGQRTRNRRDRPRRALHRYFDDGQPLHGTQEACARRVRAGALRPNFRPWGPEAGRDNGGWRSPAERRNRPRDHDDWLQHRLASAALGGYRC